MFKVGDKVRYVPNEDSPRNASTDGEYVRREGLEGVVESAQPGVSYPYRVQFGSGAILVFSEAELVKVA